MLFALASLAALAVLVLAQRNWVGSWIARHGRAVTSAQAEGLPARGLAMPGTSTRSTPAGEVVA